MGNVIQIDVSNDGNFSARKLVEPGVYKCAIANRPLKFEQAKSSGNTIIKVELKILFTGDGNETPFRGQTIYDNLVIAKNAEWKLAHFALATGAYTKDDLKNNGGQIDMDRLNEMEEVTVKVGTDTSTPPGSTTPRVKNVVDQYMFEGAE